MIIPEKCSLCPEGDSLGLFGDSWVCTTCKNKLVKISNGDDSDSRLLLECFVTNAAWRLHQGKSPPDKQFLSSLSIEQLNSLAQWFVKIIRGKLS